MGSRRFQRSRWLWLRTICDQSEWHSLFRHRLLDHLDCRMGTIFQLDRYLVRLQFHHRDTSTSDGDDNDHFKWSSSGHHGHHLRYSSRRLVDFRHDS